MNRNLIESFIFTAQMQTISAAAKALFVSQSTISHRIQLLEQDLGIILFDRQRGFKRMELTEDGRKFFPLAMQWLELNSQMHQIHTSSSLGKIRIGSMDSINQFLLPSMFQQIRSILPDLQMEFVSYHSQEIFFRLSSQLLDVGFAFYPIHYDILATPVFCEPIYMICPSLGAYPEGSIHPSQLLKKDEVFFAWDDNIARWNHEWWDENEPPYVKVDSCGLLTSFLTEPYSWATCPASVATSLKAQYNIEIHPFSVATPNRICYLLRRKSSNGYSSEGIDTFYKLFMEILSTHPWRYVSRSDSLSNI